MGISIDQEDVRRVAKLARLNISDVEITKYAADLTAILAYFEQLQSVDTTGIEPLPSFTLQQIELREDEPHQCLTQDEALQNAPESRDGYFRVPAVLDGGSGA